MSTVAISSTKDIALLPDAGPLITLAYADALDVMSKPGWTVMLVDMILHEVTRNQTPTSSKLAEWTASARIPVLPTKTFEHFGRTMGKSRNLGELAVQEIMNGFALLSPPKAGVFLFEDHKIARASFLVPANCHKVSTRAFLLYLQAQGWLESAAEVERRAILKGRQFSKLRFPAGDG